MLELTAILEVTHSVLFPLMGEIEAVTPSESPERELMRGSVTIKGRSHAIVTVDCSKTLARRLGGAMFEAEPSTLSSEDIADALGEIANIIGGNIKALLPGPSQLGLPEIDYKISKKPPAVTVEQAFRCTGELFRVCLSSAKGD